jgi:hypothetical protein
MARKKKEIRKKPIPTLIYTDVDGLPVQSKNADFIVLQFSRRKVMDCNIAETLTAVMHLTDSREICEKFKHRITFAYQGWDNDKREIYHIPQCVAFFKKLSTAWPYWVHFIELQGDSVALCLAMLATQAPETINVRHKILESALPSVENIKPALDLLATGNSRLYHYLGLTEAARDLTQMQFLDKWEQVIR